MLSPQPLHEAFDLIYGTSTGSIIGSLIALNKPVDEIRKHYLKLAPDVMSRWFPKRKSEVLRARVDEVFESAKFDAFSTDIGIVGDKPRRQQPENLQATRWASTWPATHLRARVRGARSLML